MHQLAQLKYITLTIGCFGAYDTKHITAATGFVSVAELSDVCYFTSEISVFLTWCSGGTPMLIFLEGKMNSSEFCISLGVWLAFLNINTPRNAYETDECCKLGLSVVPYSLIAFRCGTCTVASRWPKTLSPPKTLLTASA